MSGLYIIVALCLVMIYLLHRALTKVEDDIDTLQQWAEWVESNMVYPDEDEIVLTFDDEI